MEGPFLVLFHVLFLSAIPRIVFSAIPRIVLSAILCIVF